ncbi:MULTISPECIES: hypothetical protein [unclassified Corynebacterium]|uniref:hypothetical protein n=1 Tax=unclassified Corynebacterium TaxID=2624378 RepID=UPI0040344F81
MTWFKADDQLSRSKKVLQIPRRYRMQAMGLWILAGTWSAGELTDGFIPGHMLDELGATKAVAARLVASGLWREVPGGFLFNSWSEFQPSSDDVREKRARDAERKREAREKKAAEQEKSRDQHGDKNVHADAERTGSGVQAESERSPQNVRSTRPDPTRPDLLFSNENKNGADRPKRGNRFDEFWDRVPKGRKSGKDDARTAYAAAVKRVKDEQVLIDGMERYANDPNLPAEKQFIKLPATWLRKGCWTDDPLPARLSTVDSRTDNTFAAWGGSRAAAEELGIDWDAPPTSATVDGEVVDAEIVRELGA